MTGFTKVKHELGFYQASPMPSTEELEKFYRETYYQKNTGPYTSEYSPEEKLFFKNRARVAEYIWQREKMSECRELLDVGCGEGFFAAHFFGKKWTIDATDFSVFGIQKHHPELLASFTQGNIYDVLEKKMALKKAYGLINLSNVLEHVPDPVALLARLKRLMGPGTLLRVSVPNDFSELQNILVEKKLTTETWFTPPHHLNYFTFSSLNKTLESCGFRVVHLIAGFPIEIFLFNEHSNYWKDRAKGKQAHVARVILENYLINQGIDSYLKYTTASAQCGLGRDAIAFVTCEDG